MPGVLESLNDSNRRFNKVAQQHNQSILEQGATLHQVAVTVEQFVAASRRIAENADSVETSAVRSLEGCRKGRTTINSSIKGIESMAGEVKDISAKIRALGQRNRRLAGVAHIITEITKQLDLLALNAQIEAAGAGEQGKRFQAVALKVKCLAKTSSDSAAHIRQIIREIMNDINALVDSARRGLEATSASLQLMSEIEGEINEIHEEVQNTHHLAREIKVSTHQQSAAQQELASSVSDLDAQTNLQNDMVT